MKAAIVMGSKTDLPIVEKTFELLKKFGIDYEARILSAHRTPEEALDFSRNAQKNGFDLIIAAAGKAAHLPGVLAAVTTLPIIGLPIKSSTLDGMDSLLSIVQMPKGVPVATVAINGAENAAILAAQIMSLKYSILTSKLEAHKEEMRLDVLAQEI